MVFYYTVPLAELALKFDCPLVDPPSILWKNPAVTLS
jgi:hypothetical protein